MFGLLALALRHLFTQACLGQFSWCLGVWALDFDFLGGWVGLACCRFWPKLQCRESAQGMETDVQPPPALCRQVLAMNSKP